jgi:hypothetical protein
MEIVGCAKEYKSVITYGHYLLSLEIDWSFVKKDVGERF